jgi:hypothetical protein
VSNYPRSVTEAIEILRLIEQAVVEDSLAKNNIVRTEMSSFVEAQRYRVANAVRIFCAVMLQKS